MFEGVSEQNFLACRKGGRIRSQNVQHAVLEILFNELVCMFEGLPDMYLFNRDGSLFSLVRLA